ncbi:MAG TPA: carboxyl transferase domain-containing protein [Dermatophilaceae bacterium]|nr:carboxyl transferase domain-containing protein [Dermatophilaceae bacterium]
MARLSSADLIERVFDPATFVSWDEPVERTGLDPDSPYAHELAEAARRSGVDESIVTGEALLGGRRVAVVNGEFAFLAGSIGMAAAERLVRAIERATSEGLPLLASPSSGGTRMQEGTVAFLQMVKISAAVAAHKAVGLPYLVYLRHPTTGGVLASWGSLGHVTAAAPGALIGFLGPRVYEALYGERFPEGVQVAENLYRNGVIDAVLEPEQLREMARRALNVIMPRPQDTPTDDGFDLPEVPEQAEAHAVLKDGPDLDAWHCIELSRRPDRPGVRDLLRYAAHEVLPLNGTMAGEQDPGMLLTLARFGTSSCVLLGQCRQGQTVAEPIGPAALREARRGMRLAAELRLPLVTVIDTPGAALSQGAEEGGLAGEIARCLHDLSVLHAPVLSVLLGQGCGGAALALLPADHTIAAQHAWLSPLPPEGASAIVYRDTSHAAEMARRQGVRALDLNRNGVVDYVVAELPDAADEPEAFCRRLGRTIHRQVDELAAQPVSKLLAARFSRYRHLGG